MSWLPAIPPKCCRASITGCKDQEGRPGRLRERPLVGRHFSVANASSRRTQRYVSTEFAGDFDADCQTVADSATACSEISGFTTRPLHPINWPVQSDGGIHE